MLASQGRAQGERLDRNLGVLGSVLDVAASPGVDEGAGTLAVRLAKCLDPLLQGGGLGVRGRAIADAILTATYESR